MSNIRKLMDIVTETTVAGGVASISMPSMPAETTVKRVEEDKTELPKVLEYGNWENSALTTSSRLKKERKKASKVVKSIYGEDSVGEAANSKQQAEIAVAKKKEVGEGKSKKQSTVMEYARTTTRPDYRNNEKYKKYIDLRKEVQNLQMNGLASKSYIMDLRGKLQTQKDELEKELGIKLGEDGVAKDPDQLNSTPVVEPKKQGVAEGNDKNVNVDNLRTKIVAGVQGRFNVVGIDGKHLGVIIQNKAQNYWAAISTAKDGQEQTGFTGIVDAANWIRATHNLPSFLELQKMRRSQETRPDSLSTEQGVAEGYDDRKTAPGWHSDSVKNPNFNDELSIRRVSPPGKRLKSGKLSADERGSQERTKALMKFKQKQGGLTGPKSPLPEDRGVAEGSMKKWMKHNDLVDLAKPLAGLEDEFNKLLRTHDPEEREKYQKGVKQRIKGDPMAGPKGVLPEQDIEEGSLASRYSDDPTHPSFSAGAGPQKDPVDSLQGILALRKSDPARAFRALQDYGFRNPKDPIIDAASKAGSAVKRQMLQKMGITDPRPGETPKEVIQAMHRAMFDYIEKNLPTQQGVEEGLLGTALDKARSVGKKVIDVVAPDDEEYLRQLQRSMGIPASSQHGKRSMAEPVDGKLDEADLIINPASMSKRPLGLLSKPDHTDHEVEMAKSDLYQASKNALAVFQMIKDVPEEVGIEGWVQEKIIKANDYLNTIREYLEGKQLESMDGVAPSTKMFTSEDGVGEGKTGPGLWANIHAKRERIKAGSGERMRKPGSKGAPKASDFRAAAGKK